MVVEAAADVVVPTPTFPAALTLSATAPEDEATINAICPAVPVTVSFADGVDEPTPKLPFTPRVKNCVPDEDATTNGLVVPLIPITASVAIGEEVPTPTRPFEFIANIIAPDDEETANGLVAPLTPSTLKVESGVEVPTPNRVFVLSQKKFALFCEISPAVVTNGIEPTVNPVK
jgi:hypothetical protein